MKLYFENAEEVKEGILLLQEDLSMTAHFEKISDADCTITLEKIEKNFLSVTLKDKTATITYGGGATRFFRGLGYVAHWLLQGETEKSVSETPLFDTNGGMLDCSRNAVMNVKTVEKMLRKLALMGMNTFMLYTEDTYEIEGRPYFGHLRGRYTKDELKSLDAYALKLGIELIPCIQLLGHLAMTLHWGAHGAVKDTADCLLVGAEETYELIDDMLKTIAECFTSRKLHMGMDETHSLGTGAYRGRFGERPRREIYLEHLHRVVPMVKSYGFTPMMWSDMFFKSQDPSAGDYSLDVELPPNAKDMVPEGITQVFWDYYHGDRDFYLKNLERHKDLSDHIVFAGGIWCWQTFMMTHTRTLRYSIPALEACREAGTKDVLATIWHNCAACLLINSLAGLAVYAEFDYKGKHCEDDVRECMARTCHVNYDDFFLTERLEYPHGEDNGASHLILFNDPLQGQMDRHLAPFDMKTHYENVFAEMERLDREHELFGPAFRLAYALGDALRFKADFGLRLKEAYDAKDMKALRGFIDICDTTLVKLRALWEAHYRAWMYYNKAFGFKVFDIRYGGIIQRFESAKRFLIAYTKGEIDRIEELEADRLYWDTPDRENLSDEPYLNVFTYATMNRTDIV